MKIATVSLFYATAEVEERVHSSVWLLTVLVTKAFYVRGRVFFNFLQVFVSNIAVSDLAD